MSLESFYTPWKYQLTIGFSDVFVQYRKRSVVWNRLTWYFQLVDPHTEFGSSRRSSQFQDIVPCNIWMITDHTNQHKNNQKLCNEKDQIPPPLWNVDGNWVIHIIGISQLKLSHYRTNTRVRRWKWIQKSWNRIIAVPGVSWKS